ncbi:hypothetical protein BDQ17DRAFT_97828 [Cyathus striatus]|nr:hypothetical protein BDQ17DRAFT_97828 [Cyathus striatus]
MRVGRRKGGDDDDDVITEYDQSPEHVGGGRDREGCDTNSGSGGCGSLLASLDSRYAMPDANSRTSPRGLDSDRSPPSDNDDEQRIVPSPSPSHPAHTISTLPLPLPSPPSPMPPSPHSLAPLLLCPRCHRPFSAPTTLRCGHTLCASHLSSSSSSPPQSSPAPLHHCPLPSCTNPPPAPTLPRIPSQSRVRYHPAPAVPLPPSTSPPAPSEPRLDVSLAKVISLASRTQHLLDAPADHPISRPRSHTPSDTDDDHDDNDEPHSHVFASGARPRPSSASQRPRKRPRHHSPPASSSHSKHTTDASQSDEPDLLTHLRQQAHNDRAVHPDTPLPTHTPSHPHSNDQILARFEKDLLSELTCEICFVIFYQPITTPCQHTFCAKCLHRSLDHSSNCPICRQQLPGFSYFQDHPFNKTILSLLLKAFPALYQEREDAIEQEERDARLDTPIFVCQLSFPGMPTLLHFFEPRYRLMLRRCLESPSPRFGMIMPQKSGAPSTQTEYGTMLEIRSVQMLPDGRSMVETWGTFRFRILERGTLDGYTVGRIERIDDYPDDITEPTIEGSTVSQAADDDLSSPAAIFSPPVDLHRPLPPPSEGSSLSTACTRPRRPPTNDELITTCRSFLDRLQRGTAPWVVQRLSSTYGPAPTDPAAFSFWVALILPIDEHEKAKLLPLRSPRLRLLLVVHWIEQLNNNWYAWLCFVGRDGWILDGPAGPILIWIAMVLMVFRFVFRWI